MRVIKIGAVFITAFVIGLFLAYTWTPVPAPAFLDAEPSYNPTKTTAKPVTPIKAPSQDGLVAGVNPKNIRELKKFVFANRTDPRFQYCNNGLGKDGVSIQCSIKSYHHHFLFTISDHEFELRVKSNFNPDIPIKVFYDGTGYDGRLDSLNLIYTFNSKQATKIINEPVQYGYQYAGYYKQLHGLFPELHWYEMERTGLR